jgi:hypothetical protein
MLKACNFSDGYKIKAKNFELVENLSTTLLFAIAPIILPSPSSLTDIVIVVYASLQLLYPNKIGKQVITPDFT